MAYSSDLSPLTEDERREKFFQYDHVRNFGREDIQRTLGMVFRLPEHYDLSDYFDDATLDHYNIPHGQRAGLNPATVFIMRKDDIRLVA